MKNKIIPCLALVLSVVSAGCSTLKKDSDTEIGAGQSVQLPIKFAGYRELYVFIAKHANGGGDLSTDEKTLFKLAADSHTKIITLDDEKMPYVYLVESHYYNGGIYDVIRGAQGNGQYFILRPLATEYTGLDTDKGFELVGILEGNSCTLTHSNGKLQFVTTWHLSAAESPESIYEWNGKVFDRVK